MRQTTWTNLGAAVNSHDYLEVLNDAGLQYKVGKKQGRIRIDGHEVPTGDWYTYRIGADRHIYGRVTEKYRIIQNEQAFALSKGFQDVNFIRAGETQVRYNPRTNTYSGGMVWMIGELPEINILGDAFTPHIIMVNDFAGHMAVRIALCILRIICQNQFPMAFGKSNAKVSVWHTASGIAKFPSAQKMMSLVADNMVTFNDMAEGYAAMKISPRQIRMALDAMFPVKATDPIEAQERVAKEKRRFEEMFTAAYNAPDNHFFRGTAWGLINAYMDILTHREPSRKTANWEENRFVDVTFGNDAAKFIEIVDKIAV